MRVTSTYKRTTYQWYFWWPKMRRIMLTACNSSAILTCSQRHCHTHYTSSRPKLVRPSLPTINFASNHQYFEDYTAIEASGKRLWVCSPGTHLGQLRHAAVMTAWHYWQCLFILFSTFYCSCSWLCSFVVSVVVRDVVLSSAACYFGSLKNKTTIFTSALIITSPFPGSYIPSARQPSTLL